MNNVKIIYRISDAGYNKVKPDYINNESCLKNATSVFNVNDYDWFVIADNTSEKTNKMISKYIPTESVRYVNIGSGAGTFNVAVDIALTFDENDVVYFLENDYIHKPNSDVILLEGINTGGDYVSLYDHPDKYIPSSRGGNPFVENDGGEVTKVYLTKSIHWKITNSTTMTFASKVKTLKDDESILRKWTNMGDYPHDFNMFIELREKGKSLLSPIPGYSTHGESNWLSPLTDWENV
jgi:uncharacterized Fe-S cluster protein YjdI